MKNQSTNDPFSNLILDEDEEYLESAFKEGKYEEVSNVEKTKDILAQAAKQYIKLNTSKPVTIRINQLDLIKLKAKAKAKNVPYQTLLGALIRDYNQGKRPINL